MQFARILLEVRYRFQHHVILIQLGEQGRDLALTQGVVKGVVDHLRRDPQPGSGHAVDDKRRLQTFGLLIGGDIAELRQRLELVHQPRRP